MASLASFILPTWLQGQRAHPCETKKRLEMPGIPHTSGSKIEKPSKEEQT